MQVCNKVITPCWSTCASLLFACSLVYTWPEAGHGVFAALPTFVRDTCSSLSMLEGLGARLACAAMAQQMRSSAGPLQRDGETGSFSMLFKVAV